MLICLGRDIRPIHGLSLRIEKKVGSRHSFDMGVEIGRIVIVAGLFPVVLPF